jgi:hypothetical protein
MPATFQLGFHDSALYDKSLLQLQGGTTFQQVPSFRYKFINFFHPFVGDLIAKLNRDSLAGILDATWQDALRWDSLNLPQDTPLEQFEAKWAESQDPKSQQSNFFKELYNPNSPQDGTVHVDYFPKDINFCPESPYANYNWELFFHIPLMVAVHLSKTQRFAEAQRWFHYIFNPTSNDHSVDPPKRFWNFLAFRTSECGSRIEDIVQLLSIPDDKNNADQQAVLNGYTAILNKPFQPHAIARTRHLAYQYNVVMKYLDNLVAWGDSLFQQDTVESINEATQIYVLAANILGERPEQIPPRGTVQARTFAQLRKCGLGRIGDALVDLEGQFPFNLASLNLGTDSSTRTSGPLFGIGRTLYFCIPHNDKSLGYWDTVADRLFKIRHCMNIAGVVRPLALFDPPIDPGMLVKAAAAGIDIGSIVSGLNQPIGPVRSLFLIQKALELCNEVRSLGAGLLSALEKGDAEHLTAMRQCHEIQIQKMSQEVKFLQWKSAQESTKSLLTSRSTALEKLKSYQRLLGLPADPNVPDSLALDHNELTEENFDETYDNLVGQYDKPLTLQTLPDLKIAGETSPSQQSGASGQGRLYLNTGEDTELNQHLPMARDAHLAANILNTIAAVVTLLPEFSAKAAFWGLGAGSKIFGGSKLSDELKIGASISQTVGAWAQEQAGIEARTAAHERRADEWLLQYNLAAHELMQNGRQILTSLIAEQIAHHEYLNVKQQIANAQEVDEFLHDKFTNEDLYLWMQGELSRLYYEYYRFAFDTARKAERTMKQELMRPELEAQDFVKFNYWDSGRKGLLSGEALYLDVKRMEMAYHDNNKRELELTRHVSLRQLDPLSLLTLKTTGTCQVTIPEWLFDLDCPGHYLRRIKSIAISIPSVVGPYTGVHCALSLLKSSLRKSAIAGEDYQRQGTEDDRFVDYIGAVQSIVTSSGQSDSGMFDTNLRDERFLPFEGAGAESTWKLDLPKDYRAFNYDTISDVILHIRYTARQGVNTTAVNTALENLLQEANQAGLALLFSLRHDFPTEWSMFVNGTGDFSAVIRKDYFPYFTQSKELTITRFDLYSQDVTKHQVASNQGVWDAATADLADNIKQAFAISLPADEVLTRKVDAQVFLIIRYSLQ